MKKTHRILSILTAFVVFLSGAFQAPLFSNAETKTEHVTFYYLLVGVQFVNEKEFNKPYPNIKETVVLPNFGDFKKMKNIRLVETKAYDFNDQTPWENDEYLIRSTAEWDRDLFRNIYEQYTTSQISNISGNLSGRTFTKTFNAHMSYKNGGEGIECFSILNNYGVDTLKEKLFNHNGILRPLGEESQFRSNYKDCAEYLDYAINNYNKPNHDKDKLYVVFTPTIGKFEADLEVEIKQGTLNAKLNAPSQVKIGKDFEVSDATILSSDLKYVEGKLERQVGSSAFTTVATWPGPGTKGANSGRSFQDSFDSACSVTYRLTVKADNNQTSSYETTVNVSSSAGSDYSIDLNWNIDSPVYEGHNCFARDYTDFIEKTTEEDEEGNEYPVTNYYSVGDRHGGRHYFTTNATDYSERKASNITQQFNFWQKGNYKVTVEENFHGLEAYDTKYVEVLKTPTILDTLSGTQKANRKQILSADIALNPRYPLADWEIVITDNGTGEKATLSPSRLSVYTTNIKTKEVKVTTDVDGCYSHLSVEFLTKKPGTKKGALADAFSELSGTGLVGAGANANGTEPFTYEIFVKDTRNYTDRVEKDFDVSPDYKPRGNISMDNAFIREAGENYAFITLEDLSTSADGDGILRKWYIQEWNKSTEKNTYLTSEMSAAGFTEEDCKEH